MIQILTNDRMIRSQLSVLSRNLGYEPIFHAKLPALLSKLSMDDHATTAILIEVQTNNSVDYASALSSLSPNVRKIGFQCVKKNSADIINKKPDGLDYFFLLPPHAERAKARLKTALKKDHLLASEPLLKKSTGTRRFTRTAAPFKTKHSLASNHSNKLRSGQLNSRYYVSESPAAKDLIRQSLEIRQSAPLIVLAGQEGCGFESFAREYNYQINQDRTQLVLIDENTLSLEDLQDIEKKAAKLQTATTCYLGISGNLSKENTLVITAFIEFLSSLRNPHLKLILAHEYGSEEYMHPSVLNFVKLHHQVSPTLLIAPLKDRPEDIPLIAMSLLNTLRSAHPFLQVKNISKATLDYLVSIRNELNEAKLIRILRNAIALSQNTTLEIEDIKNYGEHDATTSHLVESMADESYFPSNLTA